MNAIKRNIAFASSIFTFIYLLFFFSPVNAQLGLTERNSSTGTRNIFSYRIKSTIGTSTNTEASGDVTADANATLVLKPGSKITNKFGDDSGDASATFVATPTGGNVDLKGITGENIFEFDEGTVLSSSVSSIINSTLIEDTSNTSTDIDTLSNSSILNKGSSSSYVVQDTSITVESGFTNFINTLEQQF
tara:strand:+ start:484 stop:1053 length:570 start_codon:yes stop_codon:yes gene_type:complete